MNLFYDNRFRLPVLFGLIFLTAVFIARFLVQAPVFLNHQHLLSNALSADFLITLPVCAWLLLVRQKIINFPVFFTLISVCYFTIQHILPQQQNNLLHNFQYVLAAAEVISIGWLIIRIKKITQVYQSLSSVEFDFPEKLQQSFQSVFGENKLADMLSSELVMLRYSLFFWYRHKKHVANPHPYSIYKNTPFAAFSSVFLFMLILETGLMHLLLLHFHHEKIAFGLLVLSVYSLLFIIAFRVSIKRRQIVVDAHQIHIRIGLLYQAKIRLSDVESIHLINASFTGKKSILNLAKPVFDDPNIYIKLKKQIVFTAAFGIRKKYEQFTLHIDQKKEFLETVNSLI